MAKKNEWDSAVASESSVPFLRGRDGYNSINNSSPRAQFYITTSAASDEEG